MEVDKIFCFVLAIEIILALSIIFFSGKYINILKLKKKSEYHKKEVVYPMVLSTEGKCKHCGKEYEAVIVVDFYMKSNWDHLV